MECPSSYGLIELTSRRSEGNPFLRREVECPGSVFHYTQRFYGVEEEISKWGQ
jgi:hypothetical protein